VPSSSRRRASAASRCGVAVVYDVDRPGSARLGATAVGGSPFLHPLVLLFGGLGLLFLVAAAINLAVEI
jgi:hypothetical protein